LKREVGCGLSKLPLILLPGWGMAALVWEPIAAGLAQHYELLLIDWYRAQTVGDFQTIVIEVIERQVAGSFAVLGWSLGSLVALELAREYRDRLDHLIILSGTSRFTLDKSTRYTAGWPQPVLKKMQLNLSKVHSATITAFYDAIFSELDREQGVPEHFWGIADKFQDQLKSSNLIAGLEYLIRTDHRSLLKDIQIPTLLIHGSDDRICPLPAAEFIKSQLAGFNKLSVVDGAGHLPFLTNPDRCLQEIKNFIVRERTA
jgi:pimeloyl-[acyl-carrier protein] methyl ester esterase